MSNFNPTSISEQLLFTTVRIDTKDFSGKDFFGTGFIIDYINKKGQQVPFLVTNKHVVKDAKLGSLTFLKKENNAPVFGKTQTIQFKNFENMWHGHVSDEIDVSVMPLGPALNQLETNGTPVYFISLPMNSIPSPEAFQNLDAVEEIIIVGYPKALRDKFNLTPITRKGITATPVFIDYESKPIFLIDAPVYEGSSGSPVFLLNLGSYHTKKGDTVMGDRMMLLGIVAESFYYFETVSKSTEVKSKRISQARRFLDIGVVYKSPVILETIKNALKTLNQSE